MIQRKTCENMGFRRPVFPLILSYFTQCEEMLHVTTLAFTLLEFSERNLLTLLKLHCTKNEVFH